MIPIDRHHGRVALLNRNNVDTDAIMPKQFMKSVSRTGYGPHAFDDWRYLAPGEFGVDCTQRALNPEFELNQPCYSGASILLTRHNFGCGSSREHAVWGLLEYGFRVIIAESYADIFRSNCTNNGLLSIELAPEYIEHLIRAVERQPVFELHVSLEQQVVVSDDGFQFHFEINPNDKTRLLAGLDEIGVSLLRREFIETFEHQRKEHFPWMFQGGDGYFN